MPTSLLRRGVAGLFMVGIPGPRLDPATHRILTEHPPGGVVLFKRNVESATQLRELTASLHELGAGVAPLVAIDHEGGRVDRLKPPFTHFPPAFVVARGGVKAARAVGEAMGRELAAAGFDLDFAPVLDVWTNPRNQVIGDRAFGTTPDAVTRLGLALARGLMRGGVLPCGKHFPGHGATTHDSHAVLPRLALAAATVRRMHLPPFERAVAAGLPALMTAHVVCAALDPRLPATLSPRICRDLLRRRLGFSGVLFSDDLHMGAVAGRWPPERRAVAALEAGCDMLLFCQDLEVAVRAMRGVERAVERGRLDGRALAGSLVRVHGLRRQVARLRRGPASRRLAWPAHAALARRLADAS
jgi:beta-N-acetylhexosaminidase